MKKIKYLLIVLLFIISGCSAEYNLTISDDEIKEKFTSVINKNEIPTYVKSSDPYAPEFDDQLTPFIENEQHPFLDNNDIIYDKEVVEEDTYRKVTYKYKYKKEEFINSYVMKYCFENVQYDYQNNYNINLSGAFYCLRSDSLDINIITKSKVISNNADFKKGNTYTWHIEKKDVDNVNINMEIKRNHTVRNLSKNTGPIAIVFIILILIVLSILLVLKKRLNNNKI